MVVPVVPPGENIPAEDKPALVKMPVVLELAVALVVPPGENIPAKDKPAVVRTPVVVELVCPRVKTYRRRG